MPNICRPGYINIEWTWVTTDVTYRIIGDVSDSDIRVIGDMIEYARAVTSVKLATAGHTLFAHVVYFKLSQVAPRLPPDCHPPLSTY